MTKNYREQFIQAESAAALLGISSRTLRRWKDEGKIARHSDGRYGLISLLQFAIQRRKEEAGKNAPQIELLLAQAKKTQVESEIKGLQRDKLRDSLLPAEEVAAAWAAHWEAIEEKRDRFPEVLPDELYGFLPDEIKDDLSEAQKDWLISQWRGIFQREAIASTEG